MRGQTQCIDSSFYFCKYFRCGWYKQQNSKTIPSLNKGSESPDANIFESLILKHDRAYVNVESEKSMC